MSKKKATRPERYPHTFSKDWTDEERLKVIMLLAMVISTDLAAGQYSAAVSLDDKGLPTKFRPNLTSLSGVVVCTTAELDDYREDIDEFAREMFDDKQYEDFYTQPLAVAREQYKAFMGVESN